MSFFKFLPYYNYDLRKSNFSSSKILMGHNFISHINFETKGKAAFIDIKIVGVDTVEVEILEAYET